MIRPSPHFRRNATGKRLARFVGHPTGILTASNDDASRRHAGPSRAAVSFPHLAGDSGG